MLPSLGACSEKYLTYNHTPGEKPDEPEDPDAPMPETMPKGSFKLLADKPGQVIKGLGFEIQSDINSAPDVNGARGA